MQEVPHASRGMSCCARAASLQVHTTHFESLAHLLDQRVRQRIKGALLGSAGGAPAALRVREQRTHMYTPARPWACGACSAPALGR
jgi:hypothetical protein